MRDDWPGTAPALPLAMKHVLCALVAATAIAGVSSACGGHAHDPLATSDAALLGEDGTDANDIESQASSLTAAFTLAQTATPLANVDAVVAAAAEAGASFVPAGCLTVASDPTSHTATYTLDRCFGPWGLARVSGIVTATYALSTVGGASVLHIDASSDSIRFDKATATYHATATVTARDLDREMAWSGEITGTTARGRALHRIAHWDAKWSVGQSCVRLDGSADGDVTGRGLTTTVSGYVRCKGECPRAGGDVTIREKSTGRSIDIAFTGGDRAVVSDNGKTYDVSLACTPD